MPFVPLPCPSCGHMEPGSPGGGGNPFECPPTPMCARLVGVSGPDAWDMPAGTESVSVSIVCGPITIIDCAGEHTVLAEGCGSLSWTAPPNGCTPGELCTPFRVEIPAGSAVYINWTEPCGGA